MKNFYFPLIFQPIFGDNSVSSLTQWNNTSHRIKTQVELRNGQLKQNKHSKSSKHNFLIQSTKFNRRNQQQSKQIDNYAKSYDQGLMEQEQKNQFTINCAQTALSNTVQKNKQSKYKIKKITRLFKNNITSRISTQRFAQSSAQFNRQSQITQPIKDYQKMYNIEHKNKNHNVRNSMAIPEKNKITKTSNQQNNKYLKNRIKTQNHKNNKKGYSKVRFVNSKQETQKSIALTERSIRSNKKIENKTKKLIESSKKIKVVKQLSGRRYGIQTKQQMDFDLTEEMMKIVNSNKLLKEDKDDSSGQRDYEAESDGTIATSKKSFKQISIKDIQQKRKSRRNLTMHAFQSEQTEKKKQKRSYTIWDLKQTTSEEESQQFEDNDESKKLDRNQKKKKKVHFGRTSIEQNTGKSKTKISNGYITTKKSIKLKGVIQRFNTGQSTVSIGDILAAQAPQARKIFINDKMEIKKSSKLKKVDTENVMRMNVSKGVQEEIVTNKPHPQAIILSVEKVLHQLQNERIQRTKMSNMMIDFGVKITRACVLKQVGARDKIVNYVI